MTILTATEVIDGFTTATQHWNADVALGYRPLCTYTPIMDLVLPAPIMECVSWPGLGTRPEAISRSDWSEIVGTFQKNKMWGNDKATFNILRNSHPFLMDPKLLYGEHLSFCPSATQTSKFLMNHGLWMSPESKACKLFRVTFALYLLAARVITSSQWSAPELTWDCAPAAEEPRKFEARPRTARANAT